MQVSEIYSQYPGKVVFLVLSSMIQLSTVDRSQDLRLKAQLRNQFVYFDVSNESDRLCLEIKRKPE